MSLITKFRLATSMLVLMVVMGLMVSLYNAEKKQIWADAAKEQETDLGKFALVCEQSMLTYDELPLVNYAGTLALSPVVSYAGFADNTGYGWNSSRQQKYRPIDSQEPSIHSILTSTRFLTQNVHDQNGESIRLISKPVRDRGFVWVGYSQRVVSGMIQNSINAKFRRFVAVGLVAILFGLFVAQFLSSRLVRPLTLLMKAANRIAGGEKGVQLQVTSQDEVGKLTSTFNHMSKELAKLDELKDEFMSHVTHELRSPLTSIIATVELMTEMPQMGTDAKFKRSVDRLMYGSERLNKLVDNILDLTKMQAGKMTFDIQPADLLTILTEMADFFVPRAQEKGLLIRAEVPEQFPLAMADAERIRQVLSNLIYNAIKFTNQGEIVLMVAEKDGMAEVAVKDTGVGIPQDKLTRVFEKFECLDDTRNRVTKPVPGSGLGLNIVLNSIQAQGGAVRVESQVNVGSTFFFTLPLASADIQKKFGRAVRMEAILPNAVHLANDPIILKERRKAV